MPHTIEITCYADLEELIASIVKLVGEISGKEVCQRNADDLRQAAVAIETMVAESAAIPPAVALLARCPECGSYDRESCARPYHICLNLWHKPPVQDHGPRVDTRSELGLGARRHSCNRHDDCDEAESKLLAKNPGMKKTDISLSFHCHDEECEDCFGC